MSDRALPFYLSEYDAPAKRAILTAALDLFASRGIDGVNIREIAANAWRSLVLRWQNSLRLCASPRRRGSWQQVLAMGGHSATAAKAAYVSRIWVDAQAGKQKMTAQLVGVEGFSTAADIALHAVEKALVARPKPGAHTPVTAFGREFIAGIPGIVVRFTQSGLAGPPLLEPPS